VKCERVAVSIPHNAGCFCAIVATALIERLRL
jgi:hypothetical protein